MTQLNYYFTNRLSKEDDCWTTTLHVNSLLFSFLIEIKNKKAVIKNPQGISSFFEDETNKMLNIAKKDELLNKRLENLSISVFEIEEITNLKDFSDVEIIVHHYKKEENWEKVFFSIKGYAPKFEYYYDKKDKQEIIELCAFIEESQTIPIDNVKHYMEKKYLDMLIKNMCNHPKLRLKRLM